MNTLIPDLINLIYNHLDIVQLSFIQPDVQNNYLEYKTDPKWLLYLIRKKDHRVLDYLVDTRNIDWLVHLGKYTNDTEVIIKRICLMLIQDLKFTSAFSLAVNLDQSYKHQVISKALTKSIEAGKFEVFKLLVEQQSINVMEVICSVYKYGHKDIIDYCEKIVGPEIRSKNKIQGMLMCKKNLYNRNDLIELIKDDIIDNRKSQLEYWFDVCGKYAPDGRFLEAIFTSEQLEHNCIDILKGAVNSDGGNNDAIIDYIIDRFYITKSKYAIVDYIVSTFYTTRDMSYRNGLIVQLLVYSNAIKHLNKLIIRDRQNFDQHGVFRYFNNISIETIELILPYTSYTIDMLIKMCNCYNVRYDLICYLCSLGRS